MERSFINSTVSSGKSKSNKAFAALVITVVAVVVCVVNQQPPLNRASIGTRNKGTIAEAHQCIDKG